MCWPNFLLSPTQRNTQTHRSEVGSVSLTGGLGSGDLVGSSGTSSSLQRNDLLGRCDLLSRGQSD